MEESKNLFTDRLKKPLELNWMNQLSDQENGTQAPSF